MIMKWYDASLRRLYPGGQANRLARMMNRASATMFRLGMSPKRAATLEVAGRSTGRTISCPVVIADYEGERYLVSMFGEAGNWVRNVRAANGRAVLRHGAREPVQLVEVPTTDRAAILRRYLAVAPGARAHIPIDRNAPLAEFEKVAPAYPVFLISDPVGSDNESASATARIEGIQL